MSVESFTARHPRYILTFFVVSLVFILFHVISPPGSPFPGPRWGPRPPPFDFASRAEVNAMYCGRMTGEQGWEHPPHHWGPPPPHDGRPSAWGPPPEHHHHEHKPFWGPPPEGHDGHAEGMHPPPPYWHSEHGSHHNGPPPPPPHFWGPPPPGHHHDHPEGMPPPPPPFGDEDEHHRHHHGPPPPPHRHEDHGDFPDRPPRPDHYRQGPPPPHRHEEHQHHHEKSQDNDEEILQPDVESLRCPHTMQLLGESWVCGFERIAAKEQCVVYSIGVAGESSFEGSVLKESEGCVVFGYDSKAESFGAGVPADSTRAKFSVLETTESALSTMQTNGHDFIDILKIELDDEADFIALEALLDQCEGPKREGRRPPPYPFSGRDSLVRKPRLPFGQILLTVKSETTPLAAILEKIQRMGMSPFFAGPSASKDAFDYAFINIPREHKHKADARPDAETPAPEAQV